MNRLEEMSATPQLRQVEPYRPFGYRIGCWLPLCKVVHESDKDSHSTVDRSFDAENAVIYRKLAGPADRETD